MANPKSLHRSTLSATVQVGTQQRTSGADRFTALSVLWTYASPKDLAPRVAKGGEAGATPAEIRIRCVRCNVQWIACRGKPGDTAGSFEHVDGRVRVICPGCAAEGEVRLSDLSGSRGG